MSAQHNSLLFINPAELPSLPFGSPPLSLFIEPTTVVRYTTQGRRINEQGGSLARRRFQTGSLMLEGKSWVARWREDVVESDNRTRRIRKSQVIGTLAELPTKKLARRRLEVMLARINSAGYRPVRIATLIEFSERWKSEVLSQRKPSTKMAA
ncbi:MAG: hypothetical protein WBL66_05020 [Candidatus Acidiferrales bacterium]